jgi:hypothetical protein
MPGDWRSRLTVIVTTSPLPRHPCSSMIEAILRTLQEFGGLEGCRTIIVADGYDCVGDGQLMRWKKGKISDDAASRYEMHKQRLRVACAARAPPFQDCELMEQAEHRGFALGVRRAVLAASTELVLVVQHDRPLLRIVPMAEIVSAMDERRELSHVGLPTGRTQPGTYEHLAASKYALKLGERSVTAGPEGGLRFLPLLQFYDSTHLSRRAAYLELFADRSCGFSNGDFIEDRIGQLQLKAIREQGLQAHSWHGQWVLDDGDPRTMVCHLDGRDALALSKVRAAAADGDENLPYADDDASGAAAASAAAAAVGAAAAAISADSPAEWRAAAEAAVAAAAACGCYGCRAAPCRGGGAPGVERLVRLQLLVHRTSRGCARVAQHGQQAYQKRVGVRLLPEGGCGRSGCWGREHATTEAAPEEDGLQSTGHTLSVSEAG